MGVNCGRQLSIIIPYYNAPGMLARQLQEIAKYPPQLKVVVVDDGSAVPAEVPDWIELYRIDQDIPWNRGGARNLGAHVAQTDWLVHVDIDHILPTDAAWNLLDFDPKPGCWYRFPRYRIGEADETRNKDGIPREAAFGKIHPHMDSYLVSRADYWKCGGYDEDYSGCLGGGTPFTKLLTNMSPPKLLPEPIRLHVHTRSSVPDSSVSGLSRDKTEYSRRYRAKGLVKAVNPLRFEWRKVK
jgi:hypothetical protein